MGLLLSRSVQVSLHDMYILLTECQSAYRDIALFPVRKLDYPYHISTVFHQPVPETLSRTSTTSANGNAVAESGMLDHLLVVDYRYARFALDPRTGLFSVVRYAGISLLRCCALMLCLQGLARFHLVGSQIGAGRTPEGDQNTTTCVVWRQRH